MHRRDREGETRPPTDNDCAEWAMPSNWVACLVNAPTRRQIPQQYQPRVCPASLKAMASVRLKGRPEKKGFTTSPRAEQRAADVQQVVIIIIMWED